MPTSRWDASLWDVAKWDQVSDELTADDVQSLSEVHSPALGQIHALVVGDVESAPEVTSPALGQVHVLMADSVEAASQVSNSDLTQAHALATEDIEAASWVDAPMHGQVHNLTTLGVEAQGEVKSAVLVENSATEPEFNPTGTGAVADFRGEERNRKARDERERASQDELKRIIDEAFDGKPAAVGERHESAPTFDDMRAVHDMLRAMTQRSTIEQRQQDMEQKADNDQHVLELLLLVA